MRKIRRWNLSATEADAREESERHGASERLHDNIRLKETDQEQEESNAHGNGALQVERDRLKDRLAESGEHQDRNEDALPDDDRHRLSPCEAESEDQLECNNRVEPHACGDCERIVRNNAHENRE